MGDMRNKWIFLPLLVLICGCNQVPQKDQGVTELETVDIGAGPDAGLSTEGDEQARQIAIDVGGVLPTDVPADVTIHSPSSVVDFGGLDDGRRFLAVDSPNNLESVRSQVTSELVAGGWSLASEEDSRLSFSKEDRRVIVVLEDLGAGSRIRYEYSRPG